MTNKKGIFEADKDRLFKKKNTLVDKRNKLKEQLVTIKLNKKLKIKLKRKNLKVKRSPSFDNIKRTFQKFIIRTYYFQEFYRKDLSYDLNKVQNAINNIVGNTKE